MGSAAIETSNVDALVERYCAIRAQSATLARPLSSEDACVQSMEDASPAKWHLAHTTWFFETFLLAPRFPSYSPFDADYRVLFNSYYNAVGKQYSRPRRGLLTRPSLSEVYVYREHVDEQMRRLIETTADPSMLDIIEIGLHHEQQHQELLLMDIKHLFSCNPISPAYNRNDVGSELDTPDLSFCEFEGGIVRIGAQGSDFSFDNEHPCHSALIQDYALASRLVTNYDYLEFIRADGYTSPLLWLADGWTTIQKCAWRAPMYWREIDGDWFEFTLAGLRPLNLAAPVVHVSYYEADAYARWAKARLPTEIEWESAANAATTIGNFVENGYLQPLPAGFNVSEQPAQMFGDVWEWTMSPYTPYPGFQTPNGAIGEYNGKFMSGQMVLRGGSCVTPQEHIRSTYRNFFYPANRWQFGGIRLARN